LNLRKVPFRASCLERTILHTVSLRLILISSFHLRLYLPRYPFLTYFRPKFCIHSWWSSCLLYVPPIIHFFDCHNNISWRVQLFRSSLYIFPIYLLLTFAQIQMLSSALCFHISYPQFLSTRSSTCITSTPTKNRQSISFVYLFLRWKTGKWKVPKCVIVGISSF
jgi:hypothetical protein